MRKILHAAGLRYRVNYRPDPSLRRTADVVFTKPRIAVFIDGCFWHGCPDHASYPKQNAGYWRSKLERNKQRDQDTSDALIASGWTVLRYWEHENPLAVASEIQSAYFRALKRSCAGP